MPTLDRIERRKIRLLNSLSVLSVLSSLPFVFIYLISGTFLGSLISLTSVLTFSFVIYANYRHWYKASKLIFIQLTYILLFASSIIITGGIKTHFLFFVIAGHPWLLYKVKEEKWWIITHLATVTVLFIIVEYYHQEFNFLAEYRPVISQDDILFLNFMIFIIMLVTINSLFGYFAWEYEENDKDLKGALAETQRLLSEKDEDRKNIEIANKELKRSLNQLEQLAYASSHDLKMPLRGIVSFSQLLKRRYGKQLDEDGNEYLDYIVKEGKRQFEQIEGLLNYLKADQREKDIVSIDTNNVLDEILISLRGMVEEKRIIIERSELPIVRCDASDFEQVIYNLVSNAVKFTHPFRPSRISINAIEKSGFYEFSVKDNGVGFDMEYHEQLFGIFKTLSSEDRQKGSGIGLSICKKIIQNYGGKIWAESEIDIGSTFYFTFPSE